MNSFEFDIGEKARAGSRFIDRVNAEVQRAFFSEKETEKVTQQAIATRLGVHRSVVNRQVMGLENMTARSIGELFWALGWEPFFEARKHEHELGENDFVSVEDVEPIIDAVKSDTADTAEFSLADA